MARNSISRLARAKVNLDLLITGRRDDGYHLLDSLVVFADYGDEISVRPSPNLGLRVIGPFAGSLGGEKNNIVLKTARLLQKKFNISQGAEIELVKNLPVSSGIGGGSADAAATIRALLDLWQVSCDPSELEGIILSLGADVPVCMASKTMRMSGAGEILHPVSLKFSVFLLLVNPGVSVSTVGIFRARAERETFFSAFRDLPDDIATLGILKDILASGGNDLTDVACEAEPEIRTTLDKIRQGQGCIFAGMSGSGATCFGIFPTARAAHRQADNIAREFPDWWVRCTRVL